MKTLFIDVMLYGMFQFTLRYRYCPAFEFSAEDIERKIIQRRPSLEGKPYEYFID